MKNSKGELARMRSKEFEGSSTCKHLFQDVERLLDGFHWQICRACHRKLFVR